MDSAFRLLGRDFCAVVREFRHFPCHRVSMAQAPCRGRGGGLQEGSRRPCRSPALTPAHIVQQVLAVREDHPAWGGRKIHWRLKGQGHAKPPAPSTITDILRRAGRLGERQKTICVRRFEKAFPNQCWQVDFKGHYAT